MTFYPIYVLLLSWFFISVAPLLLLRARSQRGRAVGLLAPIVVALIMRVAVPWLVRPGFHPLRVWLGDALGSAFAVLLLVLALVLYTRTDSPAAPANTISTSQPAFTR
jgi:hypothetical protein